MPLASTWHVISVKMESSLGPLHASLVAKMVWRTCTRSPTRMVTLRSWTFQNTILGMPCISETRGGRLNQLGVCPPTTPRATQIKRRRTDRQRCTQTQHSIFVNPPPPFKSIFFVVNSIIFLLFCFQLQAERLEYADESSSSKQRATTKKKGLEPPVSSSFLFVFVLLYLPLLLFHCRCSNFLLCTCTGGVCEYVTQRTCEEKA